MSTPWHGLFVPERARKLAHDFQRVHGASAREQVLAEICREIMDSNGFPLPMLVVVDAPMPASEDDDDHAATASGELFTAGRYQSNPGVISVWNGAPHTGAPVSADEMLDTFCHEVAHHLDYVLAGYCEHSEAFKLRVANLVALLTRPDQEGVAPGRAETATAKLKASGQRAAIRRPAVGRSTRVT